MKKKRSLIGILALLLVVAVGVTFAYFQSSAVFTNIFNTGTYRVVTTEVFESPSNWAPGQEIPKTITSTNEGTIPAAVRVSYTEQWLDSNNQDITSSITNGTAIVNLDNASSWMQEGNYYYYKYILNPQQTTKSFIKSVTLNPQIGSGNNEMQCTTSQDGLTQDCVATNSALGATYKLIITKETVQADKYQELWNTNVSITEKPDLVTLPTGRTKDNLQVGDEICVVGDTTECFNFIRYDGENNENIVLLSKWNLKVGNMYSNSTKIGEYTSNDVGYGLQSDETLQYRGGVPFSNVRYWYSGGLKSDYGSSYPADVYDNNYIDSTGNNYSIAYYVENYKDILETYGLIIQEARLLKFSEAVDPSIGCTASGYRCPSDSFITNTTYWLGTLNDDECPWIVNSGGTFAYEFYDFSNAFGVRPVIVISKSEI